MPEIMVSHVPLRRRTTEVLQNRFSHQVKDNYEGGTHDNRYYPGYRFDRKGS